MRATMHIWNEAKTRTVNLAIVKRFSPSHGDPAGKDWEAAVIMESAIKWVEFAEGAKIPILWRVAEDSPEGILLLAIAGGDHAVESRDISAIGAIIGVAGQQPSHWKETP